VAYSGTFALESSILTCIVCVYMHVCGYKCGVPIKGNARGTPRLYLNEMLHLYTMDCKCDDDVGVTVWVYFCGCTNQGNILCVSET
jgi:hypothetical protein